MELSSKSLSQTLNQQPVFLVGDAHPFMDVNGKIKNDWTIFDLYLPDFYTEFSDEVNAKVDTHNLANSSDTYSTLSGKDSAYKVTVHHQLGGTFARLVDKIRRNDVGLHNLFITAKIHDVIDPVYNNNTGKWEASGLVVDFGVGILYTEHYSSSGGDGIATLVCNFKPQLEIVEVNLHTSEDERYGKLVERFLLGESLNYKGLWDNDRSGRVG